ncbi:MAG: hypothetical protein QOE94_1752, partial [Mycobacterium sp.]|nr:hypothetical protein [Mycobacterium sp.]
MSFSEFISRRAVAGVVGAGVIAGTLLSGTPGQA